MPLPKIDLPLFEVSLPSTGEKVMLRPYTVKEEKILLVAQESDESGSELIATKQVVGNCLFEKNLDDLPLFDMEFLMLQLRARSVDNKMEFRITDPDTEELIDLELQIDDVKLTEDPKHTKEIKLNDDYTLFLKYPSMDTMIVIADMQADDPMVPYNIMVNCLDYIASEDEIEHFKDYTDEEITTFMDGIPTRDLKKITDFFETSPKLRHEIKYKNNTGKERTFVIEGNRSFFI
tara:strand:+ start:19 stop:720 length:702 start_codon:yes stop_codon:yes gene_type:complete